MLKFQVFLLVCLPFIAKAVFIPVNNDENPFHGSQYTSFPLQQAYNLQRSSYNQPQSRLIPLPGFGNIGNLLFPNKLTLSDIFRLKRTIKNLDTIIATIRSDVQDLKDVVQTLFIGLDSRVDALEACPTIGTTDSKEIDGSCYILYATPTMSATDAVNECFRQGGKLAEPTDIDAVFTGLEENFPTELATIGTEEIFLGAIHATATDDTYTFIQSGATGTGIAATNDGDYLTLDGDGNLGNEPFGNQLAYLCQFNK